MISANHFSDFFRSLLKNEENLLSTEDFACVSLLSCYAEQMLEKIFKKSELQGLSLAEFKEAITRFRKYFFKPKYNRLYSLMIEQIDI